LRPEDGTLNIPALRHGASKVRIGGTIVGALFALIGLVWIFQGVGVLPGSFMTGQTKWAIYGAIALVVGLAVVRLSRR